MRQGDEVQFQFQALPVLQAQGDLQRQKNGDDIVADVEMVINGMEKIYESYVDSEIVERHDYGDTRTADIFKQNASIIHDALELLKAQKPVEPTEPDEDNMRYCEACGSPVGYEVFEAPGIKYVQYSYCPVCGRPVKWND